MLTSSVYSCTLAFRWARRLIRAWTAAWEPLASLDTRSHTSMMAAQSSEVRFSSVALAVSQRVSNVLSGHSVSRCRVVRVCCAVAWHGVAWQRTDGLIIRTRSRCSKHGGRRAVLCELKGRLRVSLSLNLNLCKMTGLVAAVERLARAKKGQR